MTNGTNPPPRPPLEAAAKKSGVTTPPGMSDRAIQEAVATKLTPGVYNFAGKGDAYAVRAFELAVRQAEKPAAPPPPPAPAAPIVVEQPATPASGARLNGAGMAATARERAIRRSLLS